MTITEAGTGASSHLTSCVRSSFTEAQADRSEIDLRILELDGMSGRKYRQFINNLVRRVDRARYVEVGSWAGSTLCAAINGNAVTATAIDNWSEFGGPREQFFKNLAAFQTSNADVSVIEKDFRIVDWASLRENNIYLFDGPHSERDQYDGLAVARPALSSEFAFIVDDWNWSHVRTGTLNAIKALNLEIAYSIDVRSTLDNTHPEVARQNSDWHNGYFISVLRTNR